MGFSGGGSNVLLPHTHDGTVSQDGGPLDFNNVTQSQSASGEIFFSDGVHLQQLPIGAPNDEIRVSAGNLPEWHTPAAASATWDVLYDSGVLGVAGPLTTGTFSAPNRFIKVFFYGATVASTTQGITFNNSNGAVEYAFQSQRDFTTLVQFNNERCVFISGGFSTSNPMFSEMAFYNQDDTADKLIHLNTVVNATTGNTFPVSYQDFGKWYGGATITRLDLTDSGGTAINWKAGSRLLVLATG